MCSLIIFFSTDTASGTTMDYAWGGAAIPLSYTIELSPSFYFDEFPDNNFFLGFLYPEEKLADTVEATWQGFKAMARAVDCIGESRRFG
ncbi:hypothetical protein BaRGS_00031199 [Batillaria attramentaria]|uniref:Uncharacterized protein n=1 Tax=Batillaria attramentaria TaxID=370345 RepID=A0ABD0JR88_9CAEN